MGKPSEENPDRRPEAGSKGTLSVRRVPKIRTRCEDAQK